jgi:hypothetical protein
MVTRKLILGFLLFVLFSWFVCIPAVAVDYADFPSELQSILDERIADLEAEGGICIAGVVTRSDGARIRDGKDVQVNLLHRGDIPLRVYEGGWFIMKRTRKSSKAETGKRVILRAFGYEPIDASVTILDGVITYLEFEMTKTAPESLASVKGIVLDEADYLFNGAYITLSFPYANYGISSTPIMDIYTNTNGEYFFSGLSVCEYRLTASASGYAHHTGRFTPSIGEVTERDRILYPNRRIVIDYVYQADGNRSFTEGDLKTGTIDWLCGKDGVDFSEGQVEGYDRGDLRDLELRQVQDVLKFRNFYCNGENGFYDAGAVDFNSVTEAKEGGYKTTEKQCIVGHVYVVKTYGLKYAKFIVKTNECSFRTVSPEDLAVMKFATYGLTIDFSECNDYGQVYVRKYYSPHRGLVGVALPYYWEISGLDDLRYSANLTVSYNEDELLNLGISESNLALYRASYNGADWDRLEAKTDTANNTLQVEGITSFGLFAIVAEQTVEE